MAHEVTMLLVLGYVQQILCLRQLLCVGGVILHFLICVLKRLSLFALLSHLWHLQEHIIKEDPKFLIHAGLNITLFETHVQDLLHDVWGNVVYWGEPHVVFEPRVCPLLQQVLYYVSMALT